MRLVRVSRVHCAADLLTPYVYRKPFAAASVLEPPSDFFHQHTAGHDRESSKRTRQFVLSSQMRYVWKDNLEGGIFLSMRSDHCD